MARPRRWAVVAAALLLAGCTGKGDGSARVSPSPSFAEPLVEIDPAYRIGAQPVTWSHATRVDDRTVDVHYVANARGCRRLANVRVAESATTVTITLYEGANRASGGCPDSGTPARTRVPLGAPLASRTLVDGGATPPAERPVR